MEFLRFGNSENIWAVSVMMGFLSYQELFLGYPVLICLSRFSSYSNIQRTNSNVAIAMRSATPSLLQPDVIHFSGVFVVILVVLKVNLKTFCSQNQAKTDQNLLSWPEVLVEESKVCAKPRKFSHVWKGWRPPKILHCFWVCLPLLLKIIKFSFPKLFPVLFMKNATRFIVS